MDRDLVEQARRGDQEAFAILARTRGDVLFGIARRILRDVGLAEDAVQQALVIAWRELPRLRDPERFDAWLNRMLVYTSEVQGFTVGYPADWSVNAPATRNWQAGDEFFGDSWPYADTFVSPGEGDASIGLFVWEMPAGEGADLDSVLGLKAWAETFCSDVGASSCEEFTQRAVPMCLNAGGDSCRPAILVPTAGAQYAFFMDWISMMFTGSPDMVRVVVVGREDGHPSAARYGGSVQLLKSILTTMDVWTPG